MKYKLIKEYPGSPNLGTIVEGLSKYGKISYSYLPNNKISGLVTVLSSHVEDNPEYWEKVNENLCYVVIEDFFNYGNGFHRPWTIYNVEALNLKDIQEQLWGSVKKNIFKTKQEAEEFLLYNKPCLSLNNVRGLLNKVETDIIKGFIKSRI